MYEAAIAAVERYGWETVHQGEPEWTALHWAASEGRADVCQRLLRCAADPHQLDNLGRSAVDYGRETRNMALLELLEGRAQPQQQPPLEPSSSGLGAAREHALSQPPPTHWQTVTAAMTSWSAGEQHCGGIGMAKMEAATGARVYLNAAVAAPPAPPASGRAVPLSLPSQVPTAVQRREQRLMPRSPDFGAASPVSPDTMVFATPLTSPSISGGSCSPAVVA